MVNSRFSTYMKETKEEQILELIKQSSSVLICLPEHPSTDAIASGLALLSLIEKLEKRAKVVATGFQLPANHSFLPKSNEIFDDITAIQKFVISLDVSKTSVEELQYNVEGDKLNIYISPKDGFFTEKDVVAQGGEFAYDLILTVDAPDLESLGRIYEQNPDFFYHTPLINIDHNPANDHFGQIDLVHVTATSSSEIIFEMMKDWGDHLLDEFIATNLLTGMISKTRSFKSGSITPRSLAIASHLISQGARREDIVMHLYQSKKISTLKLWGRALSKLQADLDNKIVWSTLKYSDFTETKTTPDALTDVIDELIINTPEAKNVFLLYTTQQNEVCGLISTAPYINAMETFADVAPTGDEHFVTFQVKNSSVDTVRDDILRRLRAVIQK